MWACEHDGIEPDIMCIGKGLASGLPLAGIIARSAVMDWLPGGHGSTFGGNPVACAAAVATLDLVEDGLADNAAVVGDRLLAGLRALQAEHPLLDGRARPRPDDRHRPPRPRHRRGARAGVLRARPARADVRPALDPHGPAARRRRPSRPTPRWRSSPTPCRRWRSPA